MNWNKVLTWKIEWDDRARKELRKLYSPIQKEILIYLHLRIAESDNPRVIDARGRKVEVSFHP
jgi:mRNA-degrading endonuclease RelE of RelBE toxin-antitoxin system